MKDVENCIILTIVEKFLISPHDICKKNEIYPVLLQNHLHLHLRFSLFYREICFVAIYAFFVWRKIVAKNVPCGEKMTNIMYDKNLNQ